MINHCDECGVTIPPEKVLQASIYQMTGRVMKDGEDMGQDVLLCPEHYPREGGQPHNCEHVSFHWPKAS